LAAKISREISHQRGKKFKENGADLSHPVQVSRLKLQRLMTLGPSTFDSPTFDSPARAPPASERRCSSNTRDFIA
jgi:hypothetical protein